MHQQWHRLRHLKIMKFNSCNPVPCPGALLSSTVRRTGQGIYWQMCLKAWKPVIGCCEKCTLVSRVCCMSQTNNPENSRHNWPSALFSNQSTRALINVKVACLLCHHKFWVSFFTSNPVLCWSGVLFWIIFTSNLSMMPSQIYRYKKWAQLLLCWWW